MSGFNSFLGGLTAGQDVYQHRQSAFNAAMMPSKEAEVQVPATRQLSAPQRQGENTGTAPISSGGEAQQLAQRFAAMDTSQRQELKADLLRKGQIIAALEPLTPEEQALGIDTFGKEWGFADAARQRAAANPAMALAEVSSSIQQAEAILEQMEPDSARDRLLANARSFGNPRRADGAEASAVLMAQVAEGQTAEPDIFARQASSSQIPVNQVEPRALSQQNFGSGKMTLSAAEIMGPVEAKDSQFSAVRHDSRKHLNQYGVELQQLGWLDRIDVQGNTSAMVNGLDKQGSRNLLRTLGASKSLSKFLTGRNGKTDNYSLTRNLLSRHPTVLGVEQKLAGATYSDDKSTITNAGFTEDEYLAAVGLGIWETTKGNSNSSTGFSSNKDVDASRKPNAAKPDRFTEDRFGAPDVRKMVKNIAGVTNDAKLNGSQDFEKFLAIERAADGSLLVRSLGALGGQGGKITKLINENTVAVLHNHPYILNEDGYLIQTPTPGGDSSSLRLRNIPGYMFSDKTNTLYEIFREGGKLKYAKVKNDLTLGKGIVF